MGPREAWSGRNPQAGSWCGGGGAGIRAKERDGVPCRTGDIGGRAAGHRVFGYQILAGTRPGSQGPGQGQKPLVRAWGEGYTGSGPGMRPPSPSCRHSTLHSPGPGPREDGGQRPQYGLRPESEQRTARAGSLQSRRPRGRQPLPRFLCLWHCPGVRIYSRFSRE